MTRTECASRRKGEVLMGFITFLCVLSLGCGSTTKSDNTVAPSQEASAPDPITVTAESTHLFFRYLSEDKTRVQTTQAIDSIPKQSRSEVVVLVPDNPTPPGWEFVADLNQPLPLTIQARQGFNLTTHPRAKVAQASPPSGTSPKGKALQRSPTGAPNAPPVQEASNKTVVMFSSPGCPYCDKARNYFEKSNVSFSEYDLERDSRRARRKLSQLAQSAGVNPQTLSGVPIIFVGKHIVRGYDRRRLSQLLGI